MQAKTAPDAAPADALTIAAIAIVAYALATLLHEGLGHGGACLISGGRPLLVTTVSMECSIGNRLVLAGGTLVNLAAAALFFAIGRLTPRAAARRRFFCWLAMTIDLLMAAGYFLFSGIGGFGDWAEFIQGWTPAWLWRAVLALFGAGAYLLAARFSLLELRPLIGNDPKKRAARAARLMRISYFTGGALACVAGALNPAGWYLVALSAAAATFGGTSALMWMPYCLRNTRWFPPGAEPEQPPAIGRSWPWIAAASVLAAAFITVVGPGLRFAK
ncbi:MAG TPA: hypothetical protein VKX45_16205 [Bryobacteraceae bacterium]|jgi:hypothetical protein|nr:hypothetical protein [Bryobacteraceae bacterium]